MSEIVLSAVRCTGCGRRVGLTTSAQLRNRVYCAAWCAGDFPVLPNEDRSAIMTELSRMGRTDIKIGQAVGLSRSRVQAIVAARL